MLPSQRALFDMPRDVCFLNAAAWSPLPLASQEAGRAAVGAQGPAVEAARDFQSAAVRARPQGRRGADRRRSRRRRADLVGRLRRVDRRQGPVDPARQPGDRAGERPHLAGAGMDGPRRGRRLHGRARSSSRPTATGPRPCSTRSSARARRRWRWRRSPRCTGRTAARSTCRASPRRRRRKAPRCWSTPRMTPACATST